MKENFFNRHAYGTWKILSAEDIEQAREIAAEQARTSFYLQRELPVECFYDEPYPNYPDDLFPEVDYGEPDWEQAHDYYQNQYL